jgi:FKBP-type peptidyl-prolyl cis-trans isomerase
MTKYVFAAAIILALTAVFVGAQSAAKKPAASNTASPTKVTGEGVKTASGLIYWDIRVGNGEFAKEGKHVRVHWLAYNRKEIRQFS